MADKETKPKASTKATTNKPTSAKPAAKATPAAKTTPAKPAAKPAPAAKSATAAKTTPAKSTTAAKATTTAKAAPAAKAATTAKATPAAKSATTAKATAAEKPAAKAAPAETKQAAPAKEAKAPVKKEQKPSKENKEKKKEKGGFSAKFKAFFANKKLVAITSSALAVVLIASIVMGVCIPGSGKKGHGSLTPQAPITQITHEPTRPEEFDNTVSVKDVTAAEITGGYEKGTARAPQTSEYLGAVDKIIKPVAETLDEREKFNVKDYPTYGKNLTGYSKNTRDGIYWESISMLPEPTWRSQGIYNGIDSEGYLIKNGQRVSDGMGGYKVLYAHTASTSMYGGGLSDDEPRIIKKITAITHMKLASTQITGLYAPAGEVIKIEIPESEYKAAGGIAVYIGQNYNLDQQVAMEFSGDGVKGSGLSRMTDILSKFELRDKYNNVTIENGIATAYVGSFLGGPIYFRPINNGAERKLSVTISGAVKYQHFILGATTPEEYEFNKNSTAPYFDLEVYDSVRFTTHKYASSDGLALKDYTYENCTDAAILWDKIAEVSTRVGANGLSGASAPVYIIGDCYIAAGAAFANPGRNGVVCPPNWLAEALNYNNFVNSGCWGTMHEYNHCWQGYGVANNGEVSNNATTLVSYSLYTRISAGRTAATGWGNGGWNRFTDPSKALADFLGQSRSGNKCYDLPLYATLLHNIGQDNFIAAAHGGGGGNYMNNLVNASHYDMTYYFRDLMHFSVGDAYSSSGTIAQSQIDSAKAKNYPMFVPVASVYQVGRSIVRDGQPQDIITAQPFSYGYGAFTMDFNNKNNFAQNSFVSKALVIPDGFTVTVKSVTQPQNGKAELLGNNQVKYTPSSGKDGLYSGNFKVTLGITKNDNAFTVEDVDLIINLKQGTSTNLNRTTYTYAEAAQVPDTATVYNPETNSFDFGTYATTETRKNVCTQETNTQIWGAGRTYLGDTYNENNYTPLEVGKTVQTLDGVMYFSSAGTYRFTLKGRGRATLYLSYDNGVTWENALTIERSSGNAYVDTEYSEHAFTTKQNYVYFKVVLHVKYDWKDFFGIGVARQNADGTFPAFINAANAITYDSVGVDKAVKEESGTKFETEYHFKNTYTYSYTSDNKILPTDTKLVSVSHNPWDDTRKIEFLFDGKSDTWYHSASGEANYITAEKPLELVVDLGSVQTVNRVTFNGYKNNVGNNGMVKSFKIYGSTDGETWSLVTEVNDSPANAKNMTFSFNTAKIRYYKLVVTDTDNHRYFAMNSIVFSNYLSFDKGTMVAPNEENVKYTGNWGYTNTLSNFGIIYTANQGASVEFTFTGSRFAYFADRSEEYGKVDIYVDGKLVAENVDLSADNKAGVSDAVYDYFNVKGIATGTLAYMYTGDALSSGSHTVKIVGKSGTFNVDSFAYWD